MRQTRGILHNPGYDFYRAVRFIAEESSEIPDKLIAPYFRPVISLMCACACVEGYVHSCAQRADPNWKPEKFPREPIRRRIERAYKVINKTPRFSVNPYKDIMDMFKIRNTLTHPVLQWEERPQKQPLKDVFDHAMSHFTNERLLSLMEQFRKTITKDFGLRDVWQQRSTNMPIYDIPPDEI